MNTNTSTGMRTDRNTNANISINAANRNPSSITTIHLKTSVNIHTTIDDDVRLPLVTSADIDINT